MNTLMPSVSLLAEIRHELRRQRPVVARDPSLCYCQRCGARKQRPEQHCQPCKLKAPPPTADAGYRIGAAHLGIPVEEYRAHREADEKWCVFHKAWEPVAAFGPSGSRRDGLATTCRAGSRERHAHAR